MDINHHAKSTEGGFPISENVQCTKDIQWLKLLRLMRLPKVKEEATGPHNDICQEELLKLQGPVLRSPSEMHERNLRPSEAMQCLLYALKSGAESR
jgi:hypothetical protein